MEATSETGKASSISLKHNVSWFEFLFDTTGDLLKRHLSDASAGKLRFFQLRLAEPFGLLIIGYWVIGLLGFWVIEFGL